MPQTFHHFNLFISSPDEAKAERKIIQRAVAQWNKWSGKSIGAQIDCFTGADVATGHYEEHPIETILQQFFEEKDIHFVVGIFKTQIGSATESHVSGTVMELETGIAKNAIVMPYFATNFRTDLNQLNGRQIDNIKQFRKQFEQTGITGTFDTPEVLKERLLDDLNYHTKKLLSGEKEEAVQPLSTIPEPDSIEGNFQPHADILKKLEDNFPNYWKRVFGLLNPNGFVAPNGMKIIPEDQKEKAKQLQVTIRKWEREITKYTKEFNEQIRDVFDQSAQTFKNELFAKYLWTVEGSLSKTWDRELDDYRQAFYAHDEGDIQNTVGRIVEAAEDYIHHPPTKVRQQKVAQPEDLELIRVCNSTTRIKVVIGYGIRSEILYKFNPQYFPMMTRRSIWGLFFLANEADELVRDDETDKGFRTKHNWEYDYARFTYYNNKIFDLLKHYCAQHKVKLNESIRFGYVNEFLIEIHKTHKAEIKDFTTPRLITLKK